MFNEYFVEALLRSGEQIGFALLAFLLALTMLAVFVFLTTYLRSSALSQRIALEDRRLERQQMTDTLNRALETMKQYGDVNKQLEASFERTSQAAATTAQALESLASTFEKMNTSMDMFQSLLKENLDVVNTIANSRRDRFVLVGADSRVVAVSDRAAVVLRKDSHQIVGQPFSWRSLNLSSYDGSPLADDYLVSETLQGGHAFYNHLVTLLPNDGPRVWLRVNCEPYALPNQNAALLSFRDTNRVVYQ